MLDSESYRAFCMRLFASKPGQTRYYITGGLFWKHEDGVVMVSDTDTDEWRKPTDAELERNSLYRIARGLPAEDLPGTLPISGN